MKFQSAMEYLMTYGWAILIIAVVLIGLNYLGVFNSGTFAPKASPGACYVLRTAAEVSLAGECNGYVPRSVGQFDGSTSYVDMQNPSSLYFGTGGFTVSLWFSPASSILTTTDDEYTLFGNSWTVGYDLETTTYPGDSVNMYINQKPASAGTYSTTPLQAGQWYFITGERTGTTLNLYMNGQLVGTYTTANIGNSLTYSDTRAGYPVTSESYFKGSMANIQAYNTSLSTTTIQAMYAEGIGGAPINLQNLVGWWPLNGDVNDYSGNGNNGVNNNVYFNPNWYTSYTPT